MSGGRFCRRRRRIGDELRSRPARSSGGRVSTRSWRGVVLVLRRCPVGAGLPTEAVDRCVEGREEVGRVKGSDHLVALELCADGILELGEDEDRCRRR